MLATRLDDSRRLADPRYIAAPKLGGQRAQIHVREHRTVHAFSRPGHDLIRLPGLAWLRKLRWLTTRALSPPPRPFARAPACGPSALGACRRTRLER
jgi:hypothetical protein